MFLPFGGEGALIELALIELADEFGGIEILWEEGGRVDVRIGGRGVAAGVLPDYCEVSSRQSLVYD